MLVVRKLDQELALSGGIAKSKTRIVSWRDFSMTIRTNCRLRTLEELRAVTTDAGVMTGKVGNVRIVANFLPIIGWNFVARIASRLMFLGRVREM